MVRPRYMAVMKYGAQFVEEPQYIEENPKENPTITMTVEDLQALFEDPGSLADHDWNVDSWYKSLLHRLDTLEQFRELPYVPEVVMRRQQALIEVSLKNYLRLALDRGTDDSD